MIEAYESMEGCNMLQFLNPELICQWISIGAQTDQYE